MSAIGAGPPSCWCTGLTARQMRVCEYIAIGYSTKEIARAMGVNHRTIEEHRGRVNAKLGVRNAVELTRRVLGVDQ